MDRSADRAKALANAIARVACPLNDLAAWLGDERFLLNIGRVYVDATVCQAVAASGESKALILCKTLRCLLAMTKQVPRDEDGSIIDEEDAATFKGFAKEGKEAKEAGYFVKALYVRAPVKTAIARAAMRQRGVSPKRIQSYHQKMAHALQTALPGV